MLQPRSGRVSKGSWCTISLVDDEGAVRCPRAVAVRNVRRRVQCCRRVHICNPRQRGRLPSSQCCRRWGRLRNLRLHSLPLRRALPQRRWVFLQQRRWLHWLRWHRSIRQQRRALPRWSSHSRYSFRRLNRSLPRRHQRSMGRQPPNFRRCLHHRREDRRSLRDPDFQPDRGREN